MILLMHDIDGVDIMHAMTDTAALETFVAVARLGSVVRAAVARPDAAQLSARLAALEAAWRTSCSAATRAG
jgi:hypothetical protein